MNTENTIRIEEFVQFVLTTHGDSNNQFEYLMLYNIVEYGIKHHNTSKDQLAYFLSDIIPNVEFTEVINYVNNDYLTESSKRLKENK